MKSAAKRCARHAAAVLLLVASGCATPPVAPVEPDPAALKRVGTVNVDADQRMVVVTGFVNQVEGAIELFACGTRGKTHESVLVLDVYPVDLHAALVLLGASCGPPAHGLGRGPPKGDTMAIWVAWTQDGQRRAVPAEQMIRFRRNSRVLPRTEWVFSGSTFEDGKYKALVEESLVATYWDPWAIINIGSNVGADDELLSVNTRGAPPLHTPVTVYFVLAAKSGAN
jgi:hypothetical protein